MAGPPPLSVGAGEQQKTEVEMGVVRGIYSLWSYIAGKCLGGRVGEHSGRRD